MRADAMEILGIEKPFRAADPLNRVRALGAAPLA
jgi:hypothetical protein